MARQHVILYIRNPKPETVKAGLADALGDTGAVMLQRTFIEYTLETIRAFAKAYRGNRSIEIRYSGSDQNNMRTWLGNDINYTRQCDGTPGEQISEAFNDAFDSGAESVLLVSIECPTITCAHLEAASSALNSCDLAIGPTNEGSCYLIAIHCKARYQVVPLLFRGIAWGSGYVLSDILSAASNLGSTYRLLERLQDIRDTDDLAIWDRAHLSGAMSKQSLISIIIPTCNNTHTIDRTLLSITPGKDIEVIVADGGSTDDTVLKSIASNAHVVETSSDQSSQLAAGITEAAGKYLLLVAPGTKLPAGFGREVRSLLADPGIACGAFSHKIDASSVRYRVYEYYLGIKARVLHFPGIEQGLFMLRTSLFSVTDLSEHPVPGYFELIRRLARCGKIVISPLVASVSPFRRKK